MYGICGAERKPCTVSGAERKPPDVASTSEKCCPCRRHSGAKPEPPEKKAVIVKRNLLGKCCAEDGNAHRR